MSGKHLRQILPVLALTALAHLAPAAQPRLDIPQLIDGRVSLRLSGETGQTYRIEFSTNLVQWQELTTAVATTGFLLAEQPRPLNAPAIFYRGVLAQAARPYLTVQPSADTNHWGAAVISPETGGLLLAQGPDGTRFTLLLPTNAVAEATLVRMTLLTNVSGIPATNGFYAGVRLDPPTLRLSAAAFLEMQFTTNLPSTRISSYAFENNGSQFHLVPDLVGSDRVRIPITRLGSYGCGVFTLAELQELGTRQPAESVRRRPLASMEECYPEEEAEAEAMRQELEDLLRPIQQEAALRLGEERQKQLLGIEEPGNATLSEIMVKGEKFYAEQLLPRVAEATQKCAKGSELLTWLLGFERQRQLLGLGEDGGDPTTGTMMCQLAKRCQEQALECCETRGPDTRLITFLLGIERQRQLLGMTDGSCGSLDMEGVLDKCVPEWYGTLLITEKGQTNFSGANSSLQWSQAQSWTYEMEAMVNTVEISAIPPILFLPGYTNLNFTLSGRAQGAYTVRSTERTPWDACETGRAALRVRPLDGGDSYERVTSAATSTTNLVNFELYVTLSEPSNAIIPTSLSAYPPYLEAQLKGEARTTSKMPTANGCQVDVTVAPIDDSQIFGAAFIQAKENEFSYTSDLISYHRTSKRMMGSMEVTQEITLTLKRKK